MEKWRVKKTFMECTRTEGSETHKFSLRTLMQEITKQNYPAAENCKAVT